MKIVTKSAKETKEFARRLAVKILKKKAGGRALVLALSGDLGAGKTTFAQGFFKGVGVKARVTSPTFIIFRRHRIPKNTNGYADIFHMDAYRIKEEKELAPLGFKEILNNPRNILLIEWAENIKKSIPKNAGWIILEHGKTPGSRKIIAKKI